MTPAITHLPMFQGEELMTAVKGFLKPALHALQRYEKEGPRNEFGKQTLQALSNLVKIGSSVRDFVTSSHETIQCLSHKVMARDLQIFGHEKRQLMVQCE